MVSRSVLADAVRLEVWFIVKIGVVGVNGGSAEWCGERLWQEREVWF